MIQISTFLHFAPDAEFFQVQSHMSVLIQRSFIMVQPYPTWLGGTTSHTNVTDHKVFVASLVMYIIRKGMF